MKSVQNIHWKEWCWSWSCNTLATWCEELTHWKWTWFWARFQKSSFLDFKVGYVLSVQLLSHVRFFETPWTAAHQSSLSISNSQSLLKLISIESVMPCNHFILCRPLLLPPSIFPSIRVFLNESLLCIFWPEYWSFSFSISPSNEYSRLISFKMD